MLRQFESSAASEGNNINITGRGVAVTIRGENSGAGQLYYEAPVLNIMSREFGTFADFQKTLSQLGHNSGNVLVRLWFRRTDQKLHETMEQIGAFFKEEEKEKQEEQQKQEEKENAASSVPEDMPKDSPADVDAHMAEAPAESISNTAEAQEEPAPEATQDPTSSIQSETKKLDLQSRLEPINVFLAPANSTPAAALAPVEEGDYMPTAAQAQLHQTRLLESSRNKRLLSDREIEEREAAEQAKIDAVKSVLIKVRFPDNSSSDWQVDPSDTGAFLYQAVRHVMANDGQSFHLVIPGSKTVIKDEDTPKHNLIRAYKLSGRVLVSLVWNDDVPKEAREQPFLKAKYAQQGQTIKVPEIPTVEDDKAGPSAAPQVQKAPAKEGRDGSGMEMPKWLKLGKK